MKTPKYTTADIAKQPAGGYRTSSQTDIRKVFARIRAERREAAAIAARNEVEVQAKVQTLRKERK